MRQVIVKTGIKLSMKENKLNMNQVTIAYQRSHPGTATMKEMSIKLL